MIWNSKAYVITEGRVRQLEQSLQNTRSGGLGAFCLMTTTDSGIYEEMKHDPLYAYGSLTDMREDLEVHQRVTDLIEAAVKHNRRTRIVSR